MEYKEYNYVSLQNPNISLYRNTHTFDKVISNSYLSYTNHKIQMWFHKFDSQTNVKVIKWHESTFSSNGAIALQEKRIFVR